ncbi:MAG: ECF-type sigma factor [Panacagrimonas sp.]
MHERDPRPGGADDSTTQLLVTAFYADLRRLARRERRRVSASETLRTTALVNEAYLKLYQSGHWRDRAHFLGSAANAMRQALVTHARARLTAKRGGGVAPLPLEDADGVLAEPEEKLVSLEEALQRLEQLNPRLAQVVECRYFAGYTEAETALALGVTGRTVQRDWVRAKALLYETLGAVD